MWPCLHVHCDGKRFLSIRGAYSNLRKVEWLIHLGGTRLSALSKCHTDVFVTSYWHIPILRTTSTFVTAYLYKSGAQV